MSENNLNSAPVVIIGGGFAGFTTLLELTRRPDRPPIILIDPQPRFTFLPLLYELLSGEVRAWEIAPSYQALLAERGIVFIQESVERINTEKQIAITCSGKEINYSQAVICTGSKSDDFGVPGVKEHALTFHSLKDVEVLKQVIKNFKYGDDIGKSLIIVGAGSSGIELACKLSDLLGEHSHICLIESSERILRNGKSFNQEQCEKALKRRGIKVYLHTKVLSITASTVELSSDIKQSSNTFHLPHGALIWTGGTTPVCPELVPSVSLSNGSISIDSHLEAIGLNNVFALGDLAVNSGDSYPRNAQVAIQQGKLAAMNVSALRSEKPLMPFEYRDRGEMLSLGLGEATITGLGVTIAGPIAFQIRRMTYLSKLPSLFLGIRSAGAWLLRQNKECQS
tara:strand:+ start:325 stop:1512 length:1188 start_codon:yes stop_codon:yes gene_type:complete